MLEWNGRPLQGLTHQEVYDIIAESKQEPQVELMVCRQGAGAGGGPGGGAGARGRPAQHWRPTRPPHKGASPSPPLSFRMRRELDATI